MTAISIFAYACVVYCLLLAGIYLFALSVALLSAFALPVLAIQVISAITVGIGIVCAFMGLERAWYGEKLEWA